MKRTFLLWRNRTLSFWDYRIMNSHRADIRLGARGLTEPETLNLA